VFKVTLGAATIAADGLTGTIGKIKNPYSAKKKEWTLIEIRLY
jgi:hypothetical protein